MALEEQFEEQPYDLGQGEDWEVGEGTAGEQEMPDNHKKLLKWSRSANIIDDIDEDEIKKIGARVIEELQIDEQSRSEWMEKNEKAMKLAIQVSEKKTYPWPKASSVIYPLLTIAAVQFAARAYPAIIAGRQVVKGIILADDNGEPEIGEDGSPVVQMNQENQPIPVWKVEPGSKRKLAEKIGDHMSFQFLEEMESWEEDTDRMLHILPIVGCCFKKTYFDPSAGYNCSDLVLADNLVVNYWAKSVETAPRISEKLKLYPIEIKEMELAGLFKEYEYGPAADGGGDLDATHEFIEQHRRWDLDGDGYAEPVIITVHKQLQHVVRIVARYDEDGIQLDKESGEIKKIVPVHYYTKFDFMPNPEGGFYGFAFGQLLSPLNNAINTSMNMMLDAGHLANSSTGFIARGMSLHSGSIRFKPFEYKVVNAPGQTVRDAVVPLNFPGPNPILFQLLGMLIESGKDVASISDVMTGEAASMANMQPTTLMALIDQGLKVFTGIYKRIHRSLKREYEKVYRLNYIYMDDRSSYRHGDEWQEITKEDYAKGAGVAPVSDPTMVSSMQKLAKAQFLLNFKDDPYMNQVEIRRRAFESTDIDDIDQILLQQPPPNPEAQAVEAAAQVKQIEAQVKVADSRTGQIKDISQAVLNLARADKENGAAELDWTIGQLGLLKQRMELMNGQPSEDQNNAGVARRGAGQGGEPPMPGARQADDGNWYVDDPDRPGKYLMVA